MPPLAPHVAPPWCCAVPLLEPETVDYVMTKNILDEHGLGASSSLVRCASVETACEKLTVRDAYVVAI